MIPNNLQQSPAYALNRAHAVFHEVLSHRRLLLRYVLLPLFIVTLLWSLLRYSISYSDSHGFPTDFFTHAYPQNPPTYPPKRPASWHAAAEEVKDAFVHAYEAYERFAAPHDELRPLSREHVDNFNGWGVTIYDSLDTMLLMNLTETFERAVQQVERADFWMQPGKRAPFFETTIRHVGGLLSAYAISGRPILLDKADTLARKLAPIFNTPVGLPQFSVNTVSGDLSDREPVCLAEIASFQLEYAYLSKASGNPEHFQHADSVWNTLYKADVSKLGGMLPTDWLLKDGSPHSDKLTIGAQGDSTHEYMLKQYLLTGQTDKKLLEMYLRMTTQLITRMLWITPNRLIVWPSSTTGISPKSHRDRTFEHLACFLPGLLMLGVHTLPLDDLSSLGVDWKSLSADLNEDGQAAYDELGKWRLSEVHRWAAESLGEACAVMYADQPTGLAPDEATMSAQSVLWFDTLKEWRKKGSKGPPPGVDRVKPVRTPSGGVKDAFESREYVIKRKAYQLRPETVESMFLLWRMTGQVRWRIHGWNMFRAIVASAKVPDSGFASVFDVGVWPPSLVDDMPSYFTAETLKYLYLLFSDEELVPLDRWVFNTEAHPLPVFTWTDEEKARLGIV